MLFTLADARTAVARFVESGTCDTRIIDARINEALARLLDMEDWECLRKMVKVSVLDGHFGLPSTVEKIMFADLDGTPVRVFGQPYQFLTSGPGDLDYEVCGGWYNYLVDKGDNWPTVYDIPTSFMDGTTEIEHEGLALFAFSESVADIGKTLDVRGCNARGEEIRETVTVQRWDSGVEGSLRGTYGSAVTTSTGLFTGLTRISKQVTTGHVTLFAADPSRHFFFFLAKYAPSETLPQFRRYGVTRTVAGQEVCLLAMVRLRYQPLVDPEDIVPIDSLPALKMMVMALREENAGNIQAAMNYEAKAKMTMDSRQQANTMSKGTNIIIDIDYSGSLGQAMNHGFIL